MRTLDYILLAVADPARSATFYSSLLGIQPVENSPTFVLYVLPNGIKLGLWIKGEIEPAPRADPNVVAAFGANVEVALQFRPVQRGGALRTGHPDALGNASGAVSDLGAQPRGPDLAQPAHA